MLLPLGIGLVVGRRWPATKPWISAIQKVSMLVLAAPMAAARPATRAR